MDITIEELERLLHPPMTGENSVAADSILSRYVDTDVLVRTVTFTFTGRLVAHDGEVLALRDAACIYDTGRWADALATGELSEVEPYPGEVLVVASAIVDVSPWNHPLPRAQK